MGAETYNTPGELVLAVEECIRARDFDAALKAADGVETAWPESPQALHVAGLSHEHAFLDMRASGIEAPLSLMENAARLYRSASALEPRERLHRERLHAALQVLGPALEDAELISEAIAAALDLAGDGADKEARGEFLRAAGVAASAKARITREPGDWLRAEELLLQAPAPPPGREAWFHHYYTGVVLREVGQQENDPERLRGAARHLNTALLDRASPALQYLLVDCLLQQPDPTDSEKEALRQLAPALANSGSEDPLAAGVEARWNVFKKLHHIEESSP